MEGYDKMDSVKWVHSAPLSSFDILKNFEKDFGIVLPEEFKSFVMANNYAAPLPDEVTVDGFGEADIKRLLSFNRGDTENIHQVINRFLKVSLIPFASDSYGNYFCFLGDGVFFWEHETEEQYDLHCQFNEFLTMIH
jgi:hypothetical protein